ncbi:hypothetical protein MPER_05384, partial [Moniliophthora perniciosa FA553]
LGHDVGEGMDCRSRRCAKAGFVVVDLDGLQEVVIDYCQCGPRSEVGDSWEQLMRKQLYPATVDKPHTAFTFRTLSFFHTLTLKGKVTSYDFYHSLETRTDGAGLLEVKVCADGVELGSFADEDAPQNRYDAFMENWLLTLTRASALSAAKSHREARDPGLYTGLAYFVRQKDYQRWQKELPEQKDTSSCSGLAAVEQANTKFRRGYATTGAVDTNKGEKYMGFRTMQ